MASIFLDWLLWLLFFYLCFDKQNLFVVTAVFYFMTNKASRNTKLLYSITKLLFTLACRFLLLNPNTWILSFPASISFKAVDSFAASLAELLVFCSAWNVAVDGEEVWLIGKKLFISRKGLTLVLEKRSKVSFLVRSTFFSCYSAVVKLLWRKSLASSSCSLKGVSVFKARFSCVDAVWLRLESSCNLCHPVSYGPIS